MVTRGCEALEITLRRNALGQLGFHVNFEGVVADVEPFGFAWQAGLRPGCRLLEICKVAVGTLTHEQMIEYLRTSTPVTVVIIQPHEDGTPRRYNWSFILHGKISLTCEIMLLFFCHTKMKHVLWTLIWNFLYGVATFTTLKIEHLSFIKCSSWTDGPHQFLIGQQW